ncbi:hypothetical protein FHS82_002294 [Pseudochelatococcus lubricantis]|uniref:Uncharacterized protein n=1 Tax=Pseudochelatococcus lubricantis TaxID=1538102 RepID=A0ABX0V5P4_9HYPH|nr:hypothetical protein [Pseudochelatococcus lubricantis]NIJ58446.1 hypothetical protein [Pseudochelatococcus lubricantis]
MADLNQKQPRLGLNDNNMHRAIDDALDYMGGPGYGKQVSRQLKDKLVSIADDVKKGGALWESLNNMKVMHFSKAEKKELLKLKIDQFPDISDATNALNYQNRENTKLAAKVGLAVGLALLTVAIVVLCVSSMGSVVPLAAAIGVVLTAGGAYYGWRDEKTADMKEGVFQSGVKKVFSQLKGDTVAIQSKIEASMQKAQHLLSRGELQDAHVERLRRATSAMNTFLVELQKTATSDENTIVKWRPIKESTDDLRIINHDVDGIFFS